MIKRFCFWRGYLRYKPVAVFTVHSAHTVHDLGAKKLGILPGRKQPEGEEWVKSLYWHLALFP